MFSRLRTIMVAALLMLPHTAHAADTLTVFAAASLKNVIDEAAAAYKMKTGSEVVATYAASSALAKQIEQGAPADVFASADLAWMDELAGKNLIRPQTRVELLGNDLVVVAPAASPLTMLAFDKASFAAAIGDGKLATGEVSSVPVGKYAKAALETLGLWETVSPKLAGTENVRAALALVARGEAALGIVYGSDARSEPKVKVVASFPASSHPAIIYPFAVTATGKPEAAAFIDFLRSAEGAAIFTKAGFAMLAPKPAS